MREITINISVTEVTHIELITSSKKSETKKLQTNKKFFNVLK